MLNDDDTIEVSQIKPNVVLKFDSDAQTDFPMKLDAASLCPVSPTFCSAMQIQESGLSWQIDQPTAEGLGFNRALSAKLAPIEPINLDVESKYVAGIPPEAEFSAWSYPIEDSVPSSSSATDDSYFANMGGNVYLDRTKSVIVTAAASRPDQDGNITFGESVPWGRAWTAPLMEAGRFHKVTDPKMREAGALYHAKLGENEEVGHGDEDGQSRVICPNGGFVYLFSPTGEDADFPVSDDMPGVYFEASGGDGGVQDRDLTIFEAPRQEWSWLHCCCLPGCRQEW